MSDDDWIPVSERLPTNLQIGTGFICTIQPREGKAYTAEMCWMGGRKIHTRWSGDWSGEVIAYREFPPPYVPNVTAERGGDKT